MGYLEVKKEILDLEDEVSSLTSGVKDCERTILDKQKELSKLEEEKKATIAREKNKALVAFEEEICRPFKRKDDKFQSLKKDIKAKRDNLMKENSSDRMKAKVRGKMNITDNETLSKNIREKACSIYGEDAVEKLKVLVYKSDVSGSIEAQDDLLIQLDRIASLEDKKPNLLEGIMETLNKVQYSKDSPEKAIIPLVVIVLVIIIGLKFYPLLIVSMVMFIAYSFYKSYITLKSLTYSETFESNKKYLDELIDKRVDECVKNRANKIEDNYRKASKQLEDMIVKNEHAQEIELLKQKQMFSFNPTDIEKEYALRTENLKQSIDMTEQTRNDKNVKLNKQSEIIRQKKSELMKLLRELGEEFLPSKIIKNDNVPESFLFDIINDEPIIKKIPYEGCLFLYDDIEVCNEFIKSLYYQINSRVHPSLVNNYYYDELNMGEDLVSCSELSNYNLFSTPDEWKKQTEGFVQSLQSRVKLMREQGNIDDYNDFMRSQDCVPENKILIFHKTKADCNSLSDDNITSIIRNASKYGFTYFIFLNMKEYLKDPNEVLLKILDVIPCVFYVSNDSIKKRSKEFLKRSISKAKETK